MEMGWSEVVWERYSQSIVQIFFCRSVFGVIWQDFYVLVVGDRWFDLICFTSLFFGLKTFLTLKSGNASQACGSPLANKLRRASTAYMILVKNWIGDLQHICFICSPIFARTGNFPFVFGTKLLPGLINSKEFCQNVWWIEFCIHDQFKEEITWRKLAVDKWLGTEIMSEIKHFSGSIWENLL